MLQNKIYQNFFIEIFKTFFIVLFGLSIIALTVRAVNFLDLIVDSGYPVITYFKYSILNLFGIMPKFIPLSFLVSLTVFILNHLEDGEFVILWTSGVKKIQIVNLFFLSSIFVLTFYLLFSVFFTPLALNKSRQLLSTEQFNSFLPTIKSQQFTDSFKGFTFIVEKKLKNEIQNIFLHDEGNNIKNLSSNVTNSTSTTIIAEKGIVNKRQLILINGQIISSKKDSSKNEIIKFEQLSIDLSDLSTNTIKEPKIQETSTKDLINCFIVGTSKARFCDEKSKKEVFPTLIRRVVLPFYIPVITLICSLLLMKNHRFFSNKISIFIYSFLVLVFTELIIRFTGFNNLLRLSYIITPFILICIFYLILVLKFKNEAKTI